MTLVQLPSPKPILSLPAPPCTMQVVRTSLRDALKAVPSGSPAVLSVSAEGAVNVTWRTGEVTQGRRVHAEVRFPARTEILLDVPRMTAVAKLSDAYDLDVRMSPDRWGHPNLVIGSMGVRYPIKAEWRFAEPRMGPRVKRPSVGTGANPLPDASEWTVSAHALLKAIEKTAPHTVFDARFPAIQGLELWLDESALRVTATDRCRLVQQTVYAALAKGIRMARVVLPPEAVKPLTTFLRGLGSLCGVTVSVGNGSAVFRYEDDFLACPLMKESFPKFESMLWKEADVRVALSLADWIKPLTVAAKLHEPGGKEAGAVLEVDAEGCRLDLGETVIDLPTRDVSLKAGGRRTFGINPESLLAVLKSAGKADDLAEFGLKDASRNEGQPNHSAHPWMVETTDGFLGLVMPCNVPKWYSGRQKATKVVPPVTPVAKTLRAQPVADRPREAAERNVIPEREPCLDCGTRRGGLTPAGKYERSKGRCQSCYNKFRRQPKEVACLAGSQR